MVLCVSNIFWSPAGVTDDGLRIEPYPELEVTDGWYRLRAQVDLTMVKAVRRGIIRVGRKIGVAGARVCVSYLEIDSNLTCHLFSSSQRRRRTLLRFWKRIIPLN